MGWDSELSGLGALPWEGDREHIKAAARHGALLIGSWYRARRLERGWTQAELGWRSRIDQSVISRLETGRLRGIRLSRLALIAAALDGVDIPSLGDSPPPRPRRRLPHGQARRHPRR